MATTLNFKDIIDLPEWRPLAAAPSATTAGKCICSDLRNNEMRHPEIFYLSSTTAVFTYHIKNDGWATLSSPALAGTFAVGAACVFSTRGPRGVLAAGATPTVMTLSTALPAAVAVGGLSGRGDGQGFWIRIVDNIAGGVGKTEMRQIVANTGGTQPVITLDSPLSFTPRTGAAYEMLSGRVYYLNAGTVATNIFKYFDIATNSLVAGATTNLPTTITTDSSFVMLDEEYVPAALSPGDGFFGTLTATAAGATSLTGQAAAGDAVVAADEYRNFQIRIVEDTSAPTAAGQRRRITTHTGGPSPVYTVPAWTVTPSANAKYVVENNCDLILFTSAVGTVYRYDEQANAWDTTTYAARGANMAAGCVSFQPFGLTLDTQRLVRHSHIYSWRGGAVTTLDLLDIAAGATGVWTNGIVYGNVATGPATVGAGLAYDGASNGGKFAYLQIDGSQAFYRFNAQTRQMNSWTQLRYTQSTAACGNKLATVVFADGATKVGFLLAMINTGTPLFSCLLQR
jgi:hypothetical protein